MITLSMNQSCLEILVVSAIELDICHCLLATFNAVISRNDNALCPDCVPYDYEMLLGLTAQYIHVNHLPCHTPKTGKIIYSVHMDHCGGAQWSTLLFFKSVIYFTANTYKCMHGCMYTHTLAYTHTHN